MGGQFGTLISMNESLGDEIKYKGFSLGICMSISLLGHSMALIAAGLFLKFRITLYLATSFFVIIDFIFSPYCTKQKNGCSYQKKTMVCLALGKDFSANFGELLTYGTLSLCCSTFLYVCIFMYPLYDLCLSLQ